MPVHRLHLPINSEEWRRSRQRHPRLPLPPFRRRDHPLQSEQHRNSPASPTRHAARHPPAAAPGPTANVARRADQSQCKRTGHIRHAHLDRERQQRNQRDRRTRRPRQLLQPRPARSTRRQRHHILRHHGRPTHEVLLPHHGPQRRWISLLRNPANTDPAALRRTD